MMPRESAIKKAEREIAALDKEMDKLSAQYHNALNSQGRNAASVANREVAEEKTKLLLHVQFLRTVSAEANRNVRNW